MSDYVPWNSQSLETWSARHAPGNLIDLDGLQTHYIEKGTGAPVILLHGFFFDHYMWDRNIDALAEHYKVYAVDLWGFGYSTREPLDYGYALFTRQLKLFMDALGIRRAVLIGQSMGAGTIMQFCVPNRDRVSRIVLEDAAGMPNSLPLMGRISNLPGVGEFLYSLKGRFMTRLTLASTFIHHRKTITSEFFDGATRFQKIKGSTEIMLEITRKQFFDTLMPKIRKLAKMNIPIQIIWGEQEKAISLEIGRRLHHILNDARFDVISDAGHCPNIDQPGEFNQLVLNFLAEGS